jgi:dienelactone hydrolase
MTIFDRSRALARTISTALVPTDAAWRGAAVAVCVLGAVLIGASFVAYFVQDFTWQKLPAFVARTGALLLLGMLILAGLALVSRIPLVYRAALLVFAPFVLLAFAPGDEQQAAVFTVVLLVCVSFTGAGIAVFRHEGFYPRSQKVTVAVLAIGVLVLFGGLFAIFSSKESANPLLDEYVLEDRTLDIPNPGLPGDFVVRTTSYGSGQDRHRYEFGTGIGFPSQSVDARKLIDNWQGFSGWLRTSYWGFDASVLPVQARVWYPAGDGPFPLVLVVHGNHSMEDFSDPGYAYLGELFASRGIILASVDENFLNSSISARVDVFAERPGLKQENDARGWLLLQHLAQWRDWNRTPGHPFANKVDMDRIALIGHSRGGEAVAVAAAFNNLARYPDDARLEFDFAFNLRGVIAIAPVDGQYQPRDNGTPVRDVNYFTIHGSMDGDVQSFDGTAQYSRVTFSGDDFRFKSSLYINGANHGQFNTTWENLDTGWMSAWELDLGRIMDGEAQRNVARVYFSAFMEIVLRDRFEYLPVFADARRAAAWLPETFYISQYSSSDESHIADFEEDIDPTTMSLQGGRITGVGLSKWYEVRNSLKNARRVSRHVTHGAVFAWDKKFHSGTASLSFVLPDSWSGMTARSVISASISAAATGTLPDDWQAGEDGAANDDANDVAEEEGQALDWTVRLTDRNGASASLPLSHDAPLYPLVQAMPRRASFLEGAEPAEVLYRRFEFPLVEFVAESAMFDATSLAGIAFVFDRSDKGAIIIDDISIYEQE